MGQEWDSFGDSSCSAREGFVAFLEEVARECFRILKPGAHGLFWALPRTSHWTALALENAGFEIRDRIGHVFGCLTDDVEVLTPAGWIKGLDVRVGDRVAQWDPGTEAITLAAVEETFRAPWEGDLVVLRNADTDQLLTPNHRVWHRTSLWKRWSAYRVAEVSEVSRSSPKRLPLAGLHEGPGIGGEEYASLLGWVWTEGGYDRKGRGVRIYQSSVNPDKVAEIDALLGDAGGKHSRYAYDRTYESRHEGPRPYQMITWSFTGDMAERIRRDLPDKHPTYELLWGMTLGEKRAFLRAAVRGDGTTSKPSLKRGGGSMSLEQKSPEDREWFTTLLSLVGWRGHNTARAAREGGYVGVTRHADTTLSTFNLRSPPEFYAGDVWCLRVPKGAFVARRKGKVFITGNSGFPKSLNVAKALTKGKAPERAGEWEGWGTSLKPAVEDWWLIRKPLRGTVAANVKEHGTGALHIDACRVSTTEPPVGGSGKLWSPYREGSENPAQAQPTSTSGRWPAHLVLSHSPTCRKVGERVAPVPLMNRYEGKLRYDYGGEGKPYTSERKPYEQVDVYECEEGCPVRALDEQSGVEKSSGGPRALARTQPQRSFKGDFPGVPGYAGVDYGDGGGASRFFQTFEPEVDVPFFYCGKITTRERNQGFEEDVEARAQHTLVEQTVSTQSNRRCQLCGHVKFGQPHCTCPEPEWEETQGSKSKNHHPTTKPVKLMRYFCRLITPPGGTVLDPFSGSGSTLVAATEEGFSFVGIERDPVYHQIASSRVAYALRVAREEAAQREGFDLMASLPQEK
jgi:site-specific DNA-methyltransferase (adenine-specific)